MYKIIYAADQCSDLQSKAYILCLKSSASKQSTGKSVYLDIKLL